LTTSKWITAFLCLFSSY